MTSEARSIGLLANAPEAGRTGCRASAFDMGPDEFRRLGYRLIDRIAEFHASLPERAVTVAPDRREIVALLGDGPVPERGTDAGALLDEIAPLMFDHSLHNGHPRFLGYISGAGAPLGALADLLAAAVNANLAKWDLSPLASEVETQTVRWLAELIGFPAGCGGLLVSGGNSANLHGFLAARQAAAAWDMRRQGLYGERRRLTAYASRDTHTWIEKAADLSGLGTEAVRWIECDAQSRLDPDALRARIAADRRRGELPFLVVGAAGTVATGAIDPLQDLAALCREEGIWFHVDGAYGAPAACLPEATDDLKAVALADSVALDPHKWLYSPIEAACILTRRPDALRDTFHFRPSYYRIDEAADGGVDYYQHGLQNTRGFRALKVWLGLRHAGREGYRTSIRDDIALARHLYELAQARPDFEARSLSLSIATFRYVPEALAVAAATHGDYLSRLNRAILAAVQRNGRAFVSNAVVDGDYLLRACVVNFRTTRSDIESVVDTIAEVGESLHAQEFHKYTESPS